MNALEEHHKNSNPVQLLPQSASLAGPPHVQRGMDVHTCVHMVPGRKSDLCQSQLFTIATSGFHGYISQFIA